MNRSLQYVAVFLCGLTTAWTLSGVAPILLWPFIGFEISSELSFPGNNMARVYCTPGIGDQHLSLEVDGRNIWESPDLEPGDIGGKPIWDRNGEKVSLVTKERTLYTYNIISRRGQAFIGKEAELGEH